VQFSDTDEKANSACLCGENGHVDSAGDKREEEEEGKQEKEIK
jgi:hypothetical protein